jgi:transposase
MTERELSRAAARRLAIIRHAEEVTGNVALTCRYDGISRTLYYTWRRRYEELGVDGLRPRSRRPHTSPNATSGEVIGKIVHLRKTYHFGPGKISMYLKRYHDLEVSTSGVWRILRRLETLPRCPRRVLGRAERDRAVVVDAPSRSPERSGGVAGRHHARLVSEHYGLNPIPHPQLREQVRDVCLHGRLAHEEL